MFPEWTWIVGFILGATIGSFLNVVIYRMPRGISLAKPAHSFCPNCNTTLGPRDLIPLLSWAMSGAKCRHCAALNLPATKIASRYFWVELITGIIWAAIWWQYFVATSDWVIGVFYSLAAAAAVALTFIDFEFYTIPDEINAFLLILGITMGALLHDLRTAVLGAFVGWAILWGCAFLARVLFGKDGMGHGDIKMMRGMGALIGPLLTAATMGIAVVAGLVFGIVGIVAATRQAKIQPLTSAIPEPAYEEPETIPHLLKAGVFYLVSGDIFAIAFPRIYSWIGEPEEEPLPVDDTWKPSFTTIPFGPYLAIGCVVCMVFGRGIERSMQHYWKSRTGELGTSRLYTLPPRHKTVYRMSGDRVCDSQLRDNAQNIEI